MAGPSHALTSTVTPSFRVMICTSEVYGFGVSVASTGSGSSVSTIIGSLEAVTSGVPDAPGITVASGLTAGSVPAEADGFTSAPDVGSTSVEADGCTSAPDVGSTPAEADGCTSGLPVGETDAPGLPDGPGFWLAPGLTLADVFGVPVAATRLVGKGVTGTADETSAEGRLSIGFLTVTRHLRTLPPTFALITVFPGFCAFTIPFLLTVAIFFLLLDHLTFFLPAFFTRSRMVLPTLSVAFLQLSFGFLAAVTDTGISAPVTTIVNAIAQAAAFNTFLFLLIFTPHFLINLPQRKSFRNILQIIT